MTCLLVPQADNGREFQKVAGHGKMVEVDAEMMDGIITEIANIWPECKLVHGRARHSPSQGGVELLNQTVQRRLNAWMTENKSKAWSVGCKIVQWGIATDFSRAVKCSPYELVFGQTPR